MVAQAVDGRMPADQETIRYTGFFGTDLDGKAFLSREVLGGGSGGRYYADGNDAIHIVPDSRNQPAEFTETRFPLLVEKLALRTDSGGAGLRGSPTVNPMIRQKRRPIENILRDCTDPENDANVESRSYRTCCALSGELS